MSKKEKQVILADLGIEFGIQKIFAFLKSGEDFDPQLAIELAEKTFPSHSVLGKIKVRNRCASYFSDTGWQRTPRGVGYQINMEISMGMGFVS